MHILKITTHNSHLLEESNDKGISECMVGSPHQSKDYHVTSTFWATTVIPHPEDGNCPPHNLPLLLGTHLELYLPALKLKQGHGQQSANFFIKSGCEYFSLCRAYVASVAGSKGAFLLQNSPWGHPLHSPASPSALPLPSSW